MEVVLKLQNELRISLSEPMKFKIPRGWSLEQLLQIGIKNSFLMRILMKFKTPRGWSLEQGEKQRLLLESVGGYSRLDSLRSSRNSVGSHSNFRLYFL